jgi:hypothetical protein
MSKNLKHFIGENRHSFDDEQPPESSWDKISEAVPALRNNKRSLIKKMYGWAAAAAVFLVAVACFYLFAWKGNKESEPLSRNEKNQGKERVYDSNTSDQDYAVKAAPIYQAIERSQEELKTLSAGQPQLYDQFTQDLATLDSSYKVLKAQALKSPNREILIKAMMHNLQLQAELLSKQLSIISEYNSQKQERNDKENYRRL